MNNFAKAALSLAVFLAVLFAFLAVPVWWLESRFGSIAAISTVGGVIGVIFYAAGAWQNQRNTKHAMHTMADVIDSIEQTRSARATVERENARALGAQQVAAARISVIDYQEQVRQQQQVRQQIQRALTDALGQAAQQAPAAAWAMDDADDATGVQYYE
jgi:hypothetical protein